MHPAPDRSQRRPRAGRAGLRCNSLHHPHRLFLGRNPVIILLVPAFYIGLFVAFKVIDDLRWGGAALSAATLLGLAIIGGGHWTSDGPAGVTGDVSNIRHVTFQETPNLYFVSFDALAPRPLLNKYMGIETTEFHDLFESNFRRFPNFFADSVSTRHSFNTLLALDVAVYTSQQEALLEQGDDPDPFLFSGQNPSPLLGILHENGYESTSIYIDNYFGKNKGPYINHYVTFERHILCNLLDYRLPSWAFWGYCDFFHGAQDWDNWLTAERITQVNVDDEPQFVIAYLYSPGHTGSSFRYDNAEQVEKYRSKYLTNSVDTASYLELILRHLAENDPTAILFVFGDHGPWLSRGLDFEDNREFFVQDRFGVVGGIYPRDTCAAWFDEASAQGYITILDAVHTLLRCLSGGESALIEPRQHTPRYGLPWDVKLDYKEFLYE